MAEWGLGTMHLAQDSEVLKCSMVTNTAVVMGLHFHLRVLCLVSFSISAQSCLSLLKSLKKYQHWIVPLCLSSIQEAVVMASLGYLLLALCQGIPTSPAGQQCWELNCGKPYFAHEQCALWPGFQLQVPLACWTVLGCVKRCRFKELWVLSSCYNVQLYCLPVCTNSLLSSSTQILAYFQPIQSRKGGNNCLLLT